MIALCGLAGAWPRFVEAVIQPPPAQAPGPAARPVADVEAHLHALAELRALAARAPVRVVATDVLAGAGTRSPRGLGVVVRGGDVGELLRFAETVACSDLPARVVSVDLSPVTTARLPQLSIELAIDHTLP